VIVPIRTSEAFLERAIEVGSKEVTLIQYPGKGHEFHLGGAASRREFKQTLQEIRGFLESLGWVEEK
jgi:hypothetical protein